MRQVYDAIIFDLDGTLLDTSLGIYHSVRYVEEQMNLPPVEDKVLCRFVGPPPKEMYQDVYRLTNEQALTAAKKHREYSMQKAVYEASVYEGVAEVLKELKCCGYKLAVATLKKQGAAEKMLNNFKIDNFFDAIVGMDEKESYTKCMAIQKAMAYVGKKRGLMVGDSEYDYIGAKEAGVDFIGVLYGFGFDEAKKYGFNVIHKPLEVLRFV